MTTVERVIPPTIADDGSVHYSSVMSPSDDSIAVCHMVPDRVIPIIFVPGIMGSNLKGSDTKPSWLVNSPASMAKWAPKDSAFRKRTLDPASTTVFDGGDLPTGTPLSAAELQRRGWGTVAKKSYGDWLVWLQNALDDSHPGTDHGRKGLRASLMEQVVAPGLEKLTEAEVALSYQYRLPVHAVGYNWLQSNEVASQVLADAIHGIVTEYRKTSRCEKVIIVTHSMGGLVARHCSEIRKYSDKILGIVHGVMPATGSATAYKRVKAGWESDGTVVGEVARHVLGATAEEITAVFAQSPGALQLLPSSDYGNGWLKIRDGEKSVPPLPQGGDPYTEIYTQRHLWWGLIDDKIINPLDIEKKSVDQDWLSFCILVNNVVRKFHTAISCRYHAHTYAFYGDDKEHKTWGDVVWKRTQISSWWNDPKYDSMDKPPAVDSRTGAIGVIAGSVGPMPIQKSFEIQAAGENGDGTVPIRSGRAPEKYAKVCIAFSGVDHEGAYNPTPQPHPPQFFALWAITKLIGNVKGTNLEYQA
jgi:pimeloyl-ACP methyl ester carboxylesterase